MQAYMTAVGCALPGEPIDNISLGRKLGVDSEWIDTFIGTRTRHFSVDLDTGRQFTTLTSLCTEAASAAMERGGLSARDIDFIVMGTASPDELMPATVNRVADQLGADRIPTYQLQSGCAGAVQALDVAALLLLRPQHRNGLVIGGDVCAKHMNLDREFASLPSTELVNYVLFGDGAGAAVLSKEPAPGALQLRCVVNQLTGFGEQPGQIIRWFGDGDRHSEAQAVEESYKAIETRVPPMAAEILSELLTLTGWSFSELSHVLPPQLSGRMSERIGRELCVPPGKLVNCVADTGNNGNALTFFQLDSIRERLATGDKIAVICVESSKWIKGGFALESI
jgi:3-oxoacyl-[acyl-carrier-protein] synthase III